MRIDEDNPVHVSEADYFTPAHEDVIWLRAQLGEEPAIQLWEEWERAYEQEQYEQWRIEQAMDAWYNEGGGY